MDPDERRPNKIKEGWQKVKETATDKQVYAGFAVRTAATVVDWFWLNAIILLVLTPPIILAFLYIVYGWLPEFFGPDPAPILIWIAGLWGFVLPFVMNWLYYAGFESSKFAATPGKIIFGLRVTDVNGEPFSFWSCSVKQILTTALFSLPLFINGGITYFIAKANLEGSEPYLYVSGVLLFLIPAVGYAMAIFDKRRQTFYDKMVARIVSVETPTEAEAGRVSFFKTLQGRIFLAAVPVCILAFGAVVGTLVHSPNVNPVYREALDTPKKWQELNIARVQRKVIVERPVKAGETIGPDDVSEVRVASKDIGPDQVVCTDLVVGKKPIVNLQPGDLMTLRDLSYRTAQEARNKLFAQAAAHGATGICHHSQNRSAVVLTEYRAVRDIAVGELLSSVDFVAVPLPVQSTTQQMLLPRLHFNHNRSKVNYQWEWTGKICAQSCRKGQALERRNVSQSGKVSVVERDIEAGAPITSAELVQKEMLPSDCPYSVVSDLSLIEGKRSTKELKPGKVIRANDLVWR